LGKQLIAAADAVEESGKRIATKDADMSTSALNGVASTFHRIGDYLIDSDGDRIVQDFNRIGSRHPVALATGSAIVGFLGTRFLKSSAPVEGPNLPAAEQGGASHEHGDSQQR
jgi:hypothetical protein